MKVAVLGTGNVAQTFATKLVELGHEVMLGTRDVENTLARKATDNYGSLPFAEWHAANKTVSLGTFANAAAYGEIIINALQGAITIATLKTINSTSFEGKTFIDISNPLDFSKGFPPSLIEGLNNDNSLGEEIQKTIPNAKIVKTMNTMYAGLMINPRALGEDSTVFVSGNDADAKNTVKGILASFGWKESEILDLGDITTARGTESLLPVWLRIYGATQNGFFNFKVATGK
jgi:8-hydroxy-5-deazaflavin:NADPH oxidoreductase